MILGKLRPHENLDSGEIVNSISNSVKSKLIYLLSYLKFFVPMGKVSTTVCLLALLQKSNSFLDFAEGHLIMV